MEKAKEIIDDLEAYAVMIIEHRTNYSHKDSRNGLIQMFNGGECEIRLVASQMFTKRNAERFSRVAQVSFFMDPSLTNITLKLLKKKNTGLGRWVSMVLQGADGIRMRMVC